MKYQTARKLSRDLHHIIILDAGSSVVSKTDIPKEIEKLAKGTVYYKMIARYGDWVDPFWPMDKMTLDRAWADQIVSNFKAKVIDHVPIPNNHTDDVEANTGEVIGLVAGDDGLYGYLDIRRQETVDDIENGLIFDDSISFDWQYRDTKTGKDHGAVLLHVALVNNPYLKGMTGFEKVKDAIKQMSASLAPAHSASAIMLSESKAKELNAMLVTIKNDKAYKVTIKVKGDDGVEVEHELEAGAEIQVPQDQAEGITQQIADATDPAADEETEEEKAAREKKEADEKAAADAEAAKNNEGKTPEQIQAEKDAKELSELRAKDRSRDLSEKFDKLLRDGKVTPAQKDAIMKFAKVETTSVQLSGKAVDLSELLFDVLGAGSKVVEFDEKGTSKGKSVEKDDTDKKPSEKLSDEERAGLQAVGVRPEQMDELAAKDPLFAAELAKIDKEGEK